MDLGTHAEEATAAAAYHRALEVAREGASNFSAQGEGGGGVDGDGALAAVLYHRDAAYHRRTYHPRLTKTSNYPGVTRLPSGRSRMLGTPPVCSLLGVDVLLCMRSRAREVGGLMT